ncbi:MAG: hypothetical protein Q7S11_04235, partial [bacterium]|nr:hypothetical protein [bacterium]
SISSRIRMTDTNRTRGARGGSGLNRTLKSRASPPPSGRGSKNQNVSLPFLFLRRGVWGEPIKNGKEIFGFASPFQSPKRAILF